MKDLKRKIVLWGGTGQAKVLRPIIEYYGSKVVAVFDDTPNLPPPFPDVDLFYGTDGFHKWSKGQNLNEVGFCITIGNPHGRVRIRLHDWLVSQDLTPITIFHPSAQIADNAIIGEGSQLMAGAVVNPEAKIGRQCIINTNASVDHECSLADGVEIGPGATLCGLVQVGINGWICAGAVVLPRIRVGADAIIGAGSVVIRNVDDEMTVVGNPAGPLKERKGNCK